MTNDRHPDSRRALDGVDPPEQWDDIVDRSGRAEVVELADRPVRSGSPRWVAGAAAAVLLLVIGAVAVLAFRGGGDDGGGVVADGPDGVWGSRWRLVSISTDGGEQPAVARDGRVPELDLTEEGTLGYRGCNSGSGPARLEGDRLVTDEFAISAMACLGDDGRTDTAFMDQESAIAVLVGAGPTVSVDDDRLVLTGPSGTAAFERVDENTSASMFGRRWTATSVTVDGLERDLHAAGGLVLQFDGDEASFPGVNCWPPFGGPIDGDRWSPIATARYDCDPGGDERYDWLVRTFEDHGAGEGGAIQPITVSVDGTDLTLSTGAVELRFEESQDPAGLVGTTWTVDRVLDGAEERTLLPDDGSDEVHFGISRTEVDGETSTWAWLDGGCNGVGANGGLTFDGDRLVPGAVGSREKACAGSDGQARMDQDDWFAAFLRAEPLVLFQGNRLVLWTADARIEMSREVDPDEPVSSPPSTTPAGSTDTPRSEQVPPAAPTDFWGARWSVTSVEDSTGTWTPAVDTMVPWYPVIDATTTGRIAPTGCNSWQVSARWVDEQRLVADSSGFSTLRECSSSAIDHSLNETLSAEPRTVAFTDEIGPGWRLESDSTTLVLREEGSFTFVRQGCAANDAGTLEVYLGRDAAGAGDLVVTLLVDGIDVDDRTLEPVSDWSAPLVFEPKLWAGLAAFELSVAPADDPDSPLFVRSVEEPNPGFGCG